MKTIVTFLFVLSLSVGTYAQQNNTTPQQKLQADIKKGTVTLYILSGIVSSGTTPADVEFQEKYKVTYHDFGCVIPENIDYYREYNLLVLHHFKKKFGTKWEKDIRKNILGWKEWKPKK